MNANTVSNGIARGMSQEGKLSRNSH